jgi:ArsR family metal-binding transcriptional regulator
MLLTGYRKTIFRPDCNPQFKSLHCVAYLDQDISAALPYLNAVLGGFEYVKAPPSVTFFWMGRLITVHAKKIAINALKNEAEADKILKWLVNEINLAWKHRDTIAPSVEGVPKPRIIDILKLLPKTNCRQCSQPTCLVFACRMAAGVESASDCTPLSTEDRAKLEAYMGRFQ